MVNSRSARLDETFFALSDPTRRAMVSRLLTGSLTVAELSRPFDVSAPAISKHLRVLERAGLLTQQREGRVRRCQLNPEPLREASAWVEHHEKFWNQKLDQLAEFVEERREKKSRKQELPKPKKKKLSRKKKGR